VFLLAIFAIVTTYTWVLAPRTPSWTASIATVLVVALTVVHAWRTGEWGLQKAEFVPALTWSMLVTAAAALAMYAAGSHLGTLHGRPHVWSDFVLLLPWGYGQQFALQTVFLRDMQVIVSKRAGVLVASALFAALHLPNPFLTAMTLLGALVWCSIYNRHPNIVPLALSHAIVTLAILHAFDDAITGRLRVGVAYLALR
jgi:membrane protease YdiL (CAAX protease family)